jgi:hypothetical protein
MRADIATELAYKNGLEQGEKNAEIEIEMCTRVKVAYEQLNNIHTQLCRYDTRRKNTELIYDIQGVLNAILEVEVKLGIIKRKEDIT